MEKGGKGEREKHRNEIYLIMLDSCKNHRKTSAPSQSAMFSTGDAISEFDLPLPQETKATSPTTITMNKTLSAGLSPNDLTTSNNMNNLDTNAASSIAINLFNSPAPATLGSTPKLFHALQHHSNQQHNVGATYFKPLDFLENQHTFDSLWPQPLPILVQPSQNGGIVDVGNKLRAFCDLCHLQIFNSIFQLDYVGSTEQLDSHTIEAIGTKLSCLSMTCQLKGETKTCFTRCNLSTLPRRTTYVI